MSFLMVLCGYLFVASLQRTPDSNDADLAFCFFSSCVCLCDGLAHATNTVIKVPDVRQATQGSDSLVNSAGLKMLE